MSEFITLATAKQHLRVLNNYEDTLIQTYIDAAVGYVSAYIDRPLDGTDPVPLEHINDNGVWVLIEPYVLKPALMVGALLVLADIYANRAAQTEAELKPNPAVEHWLKPFRKMGV